MPTYRVTSPDGRTFDVEAPEGASQADVLAYVQQQATAQPRSAGDDLAAVQPVTQRKLQAPKPPKAGDRTPSESAGNERWEELGGPLGRQAGLMLRAPVEAGLNIASIGGNAITAAYNLATGRNVPHSSETYRGWLDAAFPAPQTGVEKFSNSVAQAGYGMGLQAAVGRYAKPISDIGQRIAAQLGDNVGRQLVASATSAGATELATQGGAPAPVALAAGMAGGAAASAAFDKVQVAGEKIMRATRSGAARAGQPDPTVTQHITNIVENAGIDPKALGTGIRGDLEQLVTESVRRQQPMDDAQLRNWLALRQAGVPREAITRAMVTRDPMDWQREARLQKIEGVGQPILDAYKTADSSIAQQMRGLEQRPTLSDEGFGRGVKQAVGDVATRLRADANAAYQTARAQPEVAQGVPVAGIRQWLNQREPFFRINPEYEAARAELDRLSAGMPSMTVGNLERMRQSISALRKPDGSNAGAIGAIVGLLDDAVLNAGRAAPFEDARFAHGLFKATTADQGIIDKLVGTRPGTIDPKTSPDDVFKQVVLGSDARQLRQVVNTLQVAGRTDQVQQMRAQVAGYLADSLMKGEGADRGFRPETFMRRLDALDDKLPALFTQQEIGQLKAAGRAAELVMTDVGRSAVNRSNTGNEIATMVLRALNAPGIRTLNRATLGTGGALAETVGGSLDALRNQRAVDSAMGYTPGLLNPAGTPGAGGLLGPWGGRALPALTGGLLGLYANPESAQR